MSEVMLDFVWLTLAVVCGGVSVSACLAHTLATSDPDGNCRRTQAPGYRLCLSRDGAEVSAMSRNPLSQFTPLIVGVFVGLPGFALLLALIAAAGVEALL